MTARSGREKEFSVGTAIRELKSRQQRRKDGENGCAEHAHPLDNTLSSVNRSRHKKVPQIEEWLSNYRDTLSLVFAETSSRSAQDFWSGNDDGVGRDGASLHVANCGRLRASPKANAAHDGASQNSHDPFAALLGSQFRRWIGRSCGHDVTPEEASLGNAKCTAPQVMYAGSVARCRKSGVRCRDSLDHLPSLAFVMGMPFFKIMDIWLSTYYGRLAMHNSKSWAQRVKSRENSVP